MVSSRNVIMIGLGSWLALSGTKSLAEESSPGALTAEEAKALVLELTRHVVKEHARSSPRTNQVRYIRKFRDPSLADLARLNTDTLSSYLWFDVSEEPLVIHASDGRERHYLVPVLDMWTAVSASGEHTIGPSMQTYVITGPGWKGALPSGVEEIKSPTAMGWLIGRTQTDGKEDYRVHEFQKRLSATPLTQWTKSYKTHGGKVDPRLATSAPGGQSEQTDMLLTRFFTFLTELMKKYPPQANEQPSHAAQKRPPLPTPRPVNGMGLSSELGAHD